MSKPRWKDGRLDLGDLGTITLGGLDGYIWRWRIPGGQIAASSDGYYDTDALAQRAAERWLRSALKQAAKKIGGE